MREDQNKIATLDLLHSLENISNIQDLEANFESALYGFGITGFTFFQSILVDGAHAVNFLKRPAHQEWHDRYWSQDYFDSDPCLPWSQRSRKPASWRELTQLAVTPKQHRLFEEAKEIVGEGFIIPVHDLHSLGAFVVTGRHANLDAHVRPLLRILAYGFLERAEDLSEGYQLLANRGQEITFANEEPAPVHNLTPRQIECLHWVSIGKTDWAIGEILGLSESTVHRHIERAKARLGVGTRIQAVVAAQRAKLLSL